MFTLDLLHRPVYMSTGCFLDVCGVCVLCLVFVPREGQSFLHAAAFALLTSKFRLKPHLGGLLRNPCVKCPWLYQLLVRGACEFFSASWCLLNPRSRILDVNQPPQRC